MTSWDYYSIFVWVSQWRFMQWKIVIPGSQMNIKQPLCSHGIQKMFRGVEPLKWHYYIFFFVGSNIKNAISRHIHSVVFVYELLFGLNLPRLIGCIAFSSINISKGFLSNFFYSLFDLYVQMRVACTCLNVNPTLHNMEHISLLLCVECVTSLRLQYEFELN